MKRVTLKKKSFVKEFKETMGWVHFSRNSRVIDGTKELDESLFILTKKILSQKANKANTYFQRNTIKHVFDKTEVINRLEIKSADVLIFEENLNNITILWPLN